MSAQILYKAGKNDRKAKWKPRSQRSKYKILEILIVRGAITSEELAVLLTMTSRSVSKVTQSLTVSGLITRAEDGQCVAITATGIRVWEGANRERQKWLARYPEPDFAQEPRLLKGINAG